MGLVLSGSDLDLLESATLRLLSPLDHEHPHAWMRAVMDDVRALLAATHTHFFVPTYGWVSDVPEDAQAAFRDYYHQFDIAPVVAAERKIRVSSYEALVGREAFRSSEFFNDWVHPNRLYHNHGMSFPLPPSGDATRPAGPVHPYLACSHDSMSREPVLDRGVALLRLLYPAFHAGVRTCVEHARRRDELGRLLDTLPDRLLVFDGKARLVHANPACRIMLDADPDASILEAAAARLAADVMTLRRRRRSHPRPDTCAEHEVSTLRGRYRLRSSALHGNLLGQPATLVVFEPQFRDERSDAELRDAFGLTAREIHVARLLADGLSNADIADTLGISPHTGRRHTENVLRKLGIRSRAQAADRLRRG